MGLIGPYTLIRAISVFHITVAWFFLTAPRRVVDQNVVFMLGESMRLPHIATMDKSSEASAFIAVLLTFFGLSDLTAASLDALPALEYWLANVPVRLTVLFGVTAYSWLFSEDGYLGPTLGAGRHLCNSWVFTFAFMELMIWYWIFISLREERQIVADKIIASRKAEEDPYTL
ncbi:hypothetical protein MBLNU13_g05977t1 [Cladosporium sp. NU13]